MVWFFFNGSMLQIQIQSSSENINIRKVVLKTLTPKNWSCVRCRATLSNGVLWYKVFQLLILCTEPWSVTIHLKAVEQYFTVELFVNPLTSRVKPWVKQNFLTFDSVDRTLKCDHSLESCWAVLYCGAVFGFQFCPVCNFWKFVNFGFGSVRSEQVKVTNISLSVTATAFKIRLLRKYNKTKVTFLVAVFSCSITCPACYYNVRIPLHTVCQELKQFNIPVPYKFCLSLLCMLKFFCK